MDEHAQICPYTAVRFCRRRRDRCVGHAVAHAREQHAQDLGTFHRRRHAHLDLAIKAPWSAHRGVERVRAIRGPKHEDARPLLLLSLGALVLSPCAMCGYRSGALRAVTAGNLTRFGYAACCKRGGECGRRPNQLCNERMVRGWLRAQPWTAANGSVPRAVDTALLWRDTLQFPSTF